jgi:hypothetical protein
LAFSNEIKPRCAILDCYGDCQRFAHRNSASIYDIRLAFSEIDTSRRALGAAGYAIYLVIHGKGLWFAALTCPATP